MKLLQIVQKLIKFSQKLDNLRWYRFISRLLGPLIKKTGLPLIRNVLKSLAEHVLVPQRLTAATSANLDRDFAHQA